MSLAAVHLQLSFALAVDGVAEEEGFRNLRTGATDRIAAAAAGAAGAVPTAGLLAAAEIALATDGAASESEEVHTLLVHSKEAFL